MNKAPFIDKTTYDLGLVLAANLATSNVPLEAQRYYLAHKELIPEILRCSLVLPDVSIPQTAVKPKFFRVDDEKLALWIGRAEGFAQKCFGITVDLRKQFVIPKDFPWESVIPVFDPGTSTNEDVVGRILPMVGLTSWKTESVMNYRGSKAVPTPSLGFIENSIRPNSSLMEKSPAWLRQNGKNYLGLRGYALAFAFFFFTFRECLDQATYTIFPHDRLPNGSAAFGRWSQDIHSVLFGSDGSGVRDPKGGARVTVSAQLAS